MSCAVYQMKNMQQLQYKMRTKCNKGATSSADRPLDHRHQSGPDECRLSLES